MVSMSTAAVTPGATFLLFWSEADDIPLTCEEKRLNNNTIHLHSYVLIIGGPIRDEKSSRQRHGRGVERLDLRLLAAAHASGGVPAGRQALEGGGASSEGERARVREKNCPPCATHEIRCGPISVDSKARLLRVRVPHMEVRDGPRGCIFSGSFPLSSLDVLQDPLLSCRRDLVSSSVLFSGVLSCRLMCPRALNLFNRVVGTKNLFFDRCWRRYFGTPRRSSTRCTSSISGQVKYSMPSGT